MKKSICLFILLFSCIVCVAQNYPYLTTGNVCDTSHQPILGAVIKEVGPMINSTITDINGNCFLECSCIGYVTQTVIRIGQVNNFTLQEDGEQSESMNYSNSNLEGVPLKCDPLKLLQLPDKAAVLSR